MYIEERAFNRVVEVFLSITLIFIIPMFCYKGDSRYKFFICLIYFVEHMTINLLMATVNKNILIDRFPLIETPFSVQYETSLFLFKIVDLFIILVIIFFLNQKQNTKQNRFQLVSLVFLLLAVFRISIIVFLTTATNFYNFFALVIALLASFVIECVALFLILRQIKSQLKLELQIGTYENQLHTQLEHYQLQVLHTNEIKQLRHDFNNQIETVNALLMKKQFEKASQCITEISQSVSILGHCSYCENKVIDALLMNKYQTASEMNTPVEINVHLSEGNNIHILDLHNIFSNLLDNAIKASMKVPIEKRLIQVNCKTAKGFLLIRCSNTVNTPIDLNKKRPFLNGAKIKGQGLGLQIVEKITKKYDGDLGFSVESDILTVKVAIRYE